jgi:predicted RNA methylase
VEPLVTKQDWESDFPTIIKFQDYRDAARKVRQGSKFNSVDQSEPAVLGQYIPLIYHYNMLQDDDRMRAFQAAINLLVKPGMHVLELGGGTGVLSSFAARRGATVTCVERNPELVDCATEFIRLNDLDHQIAVVGADAATYVPNRPVDVVICEMLHVGLLREKQAQVIDSFKRNYQEMFGRRLPVFIPEASILLAQPVEQSFDFYGYHAPLPMFHAPMLTQPRTTELAPLAAYSNISYDQEIPTQFDVDIAFIAEQPGTYNAIRLVTQNVLAIDLENSLAITWPNQCLVVPTATQVQCESQNKLIVKFSYEAGASVESLMTNLMSHQRSKLGSEPKAVVFA